MKRDDINKLVAQLRDPEPEDQYLLCLEAASAIDAIWAEREDLYSILNQAGIHYDDAGAQGQNGCV